MRPFLVAAAALVLLSGCGSDGVSSDDLDGTTWTSTSVTGHDLAEDSTIQLTFDSGQLTVNAGCNTMGAAYEVDDGTLKWTGPAAGTLMGCSEELMAQDQWLTGLLTDGVEVSQDDTTLTLTDDDVEIVLEAK